MKRKLIILSFVLILFFYLGRFAKTGIESFADSVGKRSYDVSALENAGD